MKLIKGSLTLLSFVSLLGCSMAASIQDEEDVFLQISVDKIVDKRKESEIHTFDCLETSSSLNKNFSFKPNVSNNIHYFFSCKPTSLGEAIDLRIYYKGDLIQKLDSIVAKNTSKKEKFQRISWLVDTNKDSSLDLVQRTYSATNPEVDLIKLLIWQKSKNNLVVKPLSKEEEEKLKSNYSVDLSE